MFENRTQAGQLLAEELKSKGYGGENTIVFAIPRGGVPVGKVIAEELGSLLDVIVTRKIPAPNQPELALGAVGPEGTRVIDISLVKRLDVTDDFLKEKIQDLQNQVAERIKLFRRGNIEYDISGKVVIIVDDGIATGATIEAGVRFLRTKSPKKIVLAAPVASHDSIEALEGLVDDMVILNVPEEFRAVGQFYKEFSQVIDGEVVELLQK